MYYQTQPNWVPYQYHYSNLYIDSSIMCWGELCFFLESSHLLQNLLKWNCALNSLLYWLPLYISLIPSLYRFLHNVLGRSYAFLKPRMKNVSFQKLVTENWIRFRFAFFRLFSTFSKYIFFLPPLLLKHFLQTKPGEGKDIYRK